MSCHIIQRTYIASNNRRIQHRNPTGLVVNEIRNLSKLSTISVQETELKTDRSVLKNLKNFAEKQRNDPRPQIIREKAENDPADRQHSIKRDVLFRTDRHCTIWKAMLPECLEVPIIQYVHTSLWHAGVEKMYGK